MVSFKELMAKTIDKVLNSTKLGKIREINNLKMNEVRNIFEINVKLFVKGTNRHGSTKKNKKNNGIFRKTPM